MTGIVLLWVGLLLQATPVLSQGAIAGTVSAAAAAVSAGSSLAGTTLSALMANGYSVTVGIEVENWTKYPLDDPETRLAGGQMSVSPRPILPSRREAMVVHKHGYTATGTYGTVSWLVYGLNRRVYVMWSAPYNFDFYSNWLAVGISRQGATVHPSGDETYNLMYYEDSDPSGDIRFQRKEYSHSVSPVSVNDGTIEIVGTMATSHKPDVKITVRPFNDPNLLAAPIRALMQRKSFPEK